MDLPTATYQMITGDPSPESSVSEMVGDIAAVYGATPPEGIPERTWRRARRQEGWRPSPATLARLRTAQRRARLPKDRERQLRSGPSIVLDADVQVSEDDRPRFIILSDWHNRPDLGLIVDHYLRGNDQAGADHIVEKMEAEVGSSVLVRNVRMLRAFETHAAAQRARWR